MDLPMWREHFFEGRTLRVTPLGPEVEVTTRVGTRLGVPVQVDVLSGLYAGQTYERVLVFSEAMKRQLEAGPAEGVLRKASGANRVGLGWKLAA
jgi:hypothetical protein